MKTREGKLRAQLLPTRKGQSCCWGRRGGLGRRQKNAASLRPSSPRCPPAPSPPLGKWEVTGGHQEELLQGVVFVGHPGGWEVYDLAATAVSKSCTQKLTEGGILMRMHTAPESCNRRNCMYVAVRVLPWHISHPLSVWGNPSALKNFSMSGRQCRELMDQTLA